MGLLAFVDGAGGYYQVDVPDGVPAPVWTAALTPVEPVAAVEPPPPAVVTMRQARLALLQAGLLAQVQAAIDAATGLTGDAARIEWEYSNTIERDSPLIAGFAAALGLTGAQLDNLFRAAGGL